MTFCIQVCVLLEKEGPLHPGAEHHIKLLQLPLGYTNCQSWDGGDAMVGSLIAAKKEKSIAVLPLESQNSGGQSSGSGGGGDLNFITSGSRVAQCPPKDRT